MSGVQRRSANTWESGSDWKRSQAEQALRALNERKSEVEKASRARDTRKEALRSGGASAAAVVWHGALEESWENPGGPAIPQIRAVATWQPRGKTADPDRMRLALARHLYGRYTTPAFLDAMWVVNVGVAQPPPANRYDQRWRPERIRANPDLRFAAMWKAIASGVSLYKSCMAGNNLLSRKETHVFLSAPDWCSVRQALWWARVMFATGNRSAADVVARSRLPDFAGGPAETPSPRWTAVARFFAGLVGQPDGFRGDELGEVLDWVQAMIRDNPEWSIEGRTARTVRLASRDWHKLQTRIRLWSKENWTGFPLDEWTASEGEENTKSYRVWRVRQITTGKELAAEGHAQRHCVGSYIERCRSGSCAIFSMTVEDASTVGRQRALTIELSSGWRVVQAKGVGNRHPTARESRMLEGWCRANDLELAV